MMYALLIQKQASKIEQISLDWVEKPLPTFDHSSQHCLIKVAASGVNISDVLATMGYFQYAVFPRIPGRDFAGTVINGPAMWLGKQVWGTGGSAGIEQDGTQAEYIVLPTTALSKIPENLDLITAAAQPLPYVTAYYSLICRASLKKHESVLVIGALGAVGRAAMSICSWKNCKAIALVRGKQAEKEAIQLWGVKQVINTDNCRALQENILALNNGHPIEVVLNSVGNYYWPILLSILAPFGRILIISARKKLRRANINLFHLYRKNQTIMGINTLAFSFENNAKLLNELNTAFNQQTLTPLSVDSSTIYAPWQATHAYQAVIRHTPPKRVVIRMG